MFSRIFPKQFDNNFRGDPLAIWLFGLVVLVKGLQGANSIIMTRSVATGPDGIPLDSFGAAGAEAVLSLFALLGMYLLILPLQSFVVLIRYRTMIPLMYLFLIVTQVGSRVLQWVHPIERSSTLPYGIIINLVILAVTVLGFVLSLQNRKSAR
jgi:hypothetical protein